METIKNIYFHSTADGSMLEPFPFITELAMEGYILENPALLKFQESDIVPKIKEIEKQWVGTDRKNGRIDLLVAYGESFYAVVELKKGLLDENAFNQLKRYMDKESLRNAERTDFEDFSDKCNWIGVLVRSSLDDKLVGLIEEHNSDTSSFQFAVIILNRYKSEGKLFSFTDVYFPKNKKPPKYIFDGEEYRTSRLTHAMVKKYLLGSKDALTFDSLTSLLGKAKKPIVMRFSEAKKDWDKGDRNYYVQPKDILTLKDGTEIAVLSWWYVNEIDKIKEIADSFGYTFSEI